MRELSTTVCLFLGDVQAKLMVREIDSNNDGEVSWEEFYEMLSRGNDSAAFDSRLASPSSTSTIDDQEALPPR